MPPRHRDGIVFADGVRRAGSRLNPSSPHNQGVKPMTQTAGTMRPELFSDTSHHEEGQVARMIEQQTAKIPSDWFLWAACGSIAGSLALQLMGADSKATFVGQWAPTFLILGLYNKIVKTHGSD
jgi:hypothetical protein